MTVEEALAITESILGNTGLSDLQEAIFRQSWEQKTYPEIAEAAGYDAEYIKLVGFQFWKTLSQALSEKVTKNNFRSVLRRKLNLINNQIPTSLTPRTPSTDWGEAIDVSLFYGRTQELILLEQWILQDNCRLVALLGIGGIGKTSLCVKLTEKIQQQFEYIIWRSLHNAPKIESLLVNLIQFFSQGQETNLAESVGEKITQLINYLQRHRCLLILDNVETILYRSGYEKYGELFQSIGECRHQSCLLLTSREKPKELVVLAGETLPVRCLQLSGLSITDAQSLFSSKGRFNGSVNDWQNLIQSYSGNPLALKIVAATIRDLFDSNLHTFIDKSVIVFGEIEELIEQQFQCSSDLEKEILYWLAINREAVPFCEIQDDLLIPIYPSQLLAALQGLERRSLMEISASAFTLQPVLMEYMTNRLIKQVSRELENQEIFLFKTHALFKTTTKDYIQEIQIALIINPIIKQLLYIFGTKKRIEYQLMTIINSLRHGKPVDTGYVCGNTINLFRQLQIDLSEKDFSNLTIWQADFQGADLHETNFTNSDLTKSSFTTNLSYPFTVAVSRDGNIVATGDSQGKISLWQVTNGQQLIAWEGHTGWVRWIVFTANNNLISGSDDGNIKKWDIIGRCLQIFEGHNGFVLSVALAETDNYPILASSSMDQTLKVWNFQTGECLLTLQGHTGWFPWISLSPDGQTLVSGSADNVVKFWSVNTGKCLKTLLGHNNNIWSVVFCLNGKYVVSGDGDGIIKIWDVKTGQCLHTLVGHTAQVWCVTCNINSILASCSGDKTIRLWDIETGECLKILRGHTNGIRSMAFTPQGQLIATDEDKTVKFWDTNTGKCYKTFQGYGDGVWAVALSTSNHILASGNEDQTIKLWDINTGTCMRTLQGHTNFVPALAFSPDAKTLASGSSDETVRIWDLETGECLHIFNGHYNWIMAVTYSPDSKILVSSGSDRKLRFWDVNTGKCLGLLDHSTAMILSLVYNHDGNLLIGCGGEDMMIHAWDSKTLKCVKTFAGHHHGIWSVVFNPAFPNKIIASGSEDKTIKIWDVETGECLKTFTGHTHAIVSVAYSPDGSLLASGSKDQTVKIWDVETGKCIKTFRGHTRWIYKVIFINSSCVVSSSQDQTIRLWDIETSDCLKILKSPRPYENMNIIGMTGLTQTTKATLLSLGAKEHN